MSEIAGDAFFWVHFSTFSLGEHTHTPCTGGVNFTRTDHPSPLLLRSGEDFLRVGGVGSRIFASLEAERMVSSNAFFIVVFF